MFISNVLQHRFRDLSVACVLFFSVLSSNVANAEDMQKTARQSFGLIEGKIEIGEKVSKCKFPAPSSTVRAYRLYSPGYSVAAVIPSSGKYKLKVPPGPYAVLFDVWSSSGAPLKQPAIFVWINPGESYVNDGTPARISISKTLLTDLNGNPYSVGEGLSYDYTAFMTAFLINDLKKKNTELEVVEDSSLVSYAEILALIDANSAPEIPEAQRLDKALAIAHLESPAIAYKLQGTMKVASLPKAETKSVTAQPTLQTNLSIFEQSEQSPVASDESAVKTKSAFDKAVDKRIKDLLKSLLEQINDLPLPAKLYLNFQGERIFDAWEKGQLGTAKETWEVGPIILKRDPTLDRSSSSRKLRVGGYSIDKATMLSACSWKIVGLGSVQYSGELFEATNLDSPSVIQILLEKVKKDSTSQRYYIGGEIFEKTLVKVHLSDPSKHIDLYFDFDPILSVMANGQAAPYKAGSPISINTTYQGQEPTSTQPTKWTYQLMTP